MFDEMYNNAHGITSFIIIESIKKKFNKRYTLIMKIVK